MASRTGQDPGETGRTADGITCDPITASPSRPFVIDIAAEATSYRAMMTIPFSSGLYYAPLT